MNLTDKQRKILQYVGFIVIVVVVLFVSLAITGPSDSKSHLIDDEQQEKEIPLSKLTDGARESDLWREQSVREMNAMRDELNDLKNGSTISRSEFIALKDNFEKLQREKEKDDQNAIEVIDQQQSVIRALQDDITILKAQKAATPVTDIPATSNRPQPGGDPFRRANSGGKAGKDNNQPYTPASAIEKIVFELEEPEGQIKTFNSDTYIPAGSYVQATVIEGVSASVGITASADPRPIALRVTGKAISAIGFNGPETFDLSGCLAQGAARGDLSSERVYVQLLKLTCTHEAGTVFEVDVKGHVSSNGQAGIRGNVVQRNGEFLQKTFISGIFAGGGEGLNSLSQPTSTFGGSGFATQERPDLGDVAGIAVGKGFSQTGDRLSDYYIKQAEQYQPVVEVTPGITVEIVFTEGVKLDVQ